jgi:hypothetical protein
LMHNKLIDHTSLACREITHKTKSVNLLASRTATVIYFFTLLFIHKIYVLGENSNRSGFASELLCRDKQIALLVVRRDDGTTARHNTCWATEPDK